MFNSSILDVAFGVVFSFLAVSLVSSAVLEAISSALKWRSQNLRTGIGQMLNDPDFKGLAGLLYQHAAINPLSVFAAPGPVSRPVATGTTGPTGATSATGATGATGDAGATAGAKPAGGITPDNSDIDRVSRVKDPTKADKVKASLGFGAARQEPAYIQPKQFAAALMDIAGLADAGARTYVDANARIDAMLADLRAAPGLGNGQIVAFLEGIVQRSRGDVAAIEKALAAWFDNGMDRLSGAYKRKAQLVSFIVALLLAGMLNVDTIRIASTIWKQPTLVENLKLPPDIAAAMPAKPATDSPPSSIAATPPLDDAALKQQLDRDSIAATSALELLDQHLPVGWTGPGAFGWTTIPGWLITAFATLFGAPFWFDALQSIVRLKGAGPSPADKKKGRAASS